MPHPKFGTRHMCFDCSVKFYDMKKEKAICPKCGADQAKAPKRASSKPAKKVAQPEYFEDDTEETEKEDTGAPEELSEDLPMSGGDAPTDDDEGFNSNNKESIAIDDFPDQEL